MLLLLLLFVVGDGVCGVVFFLSLSLPYLWLLWVVVIVVVVAAAGAVF